MTLLARTFLAFAACRVSAVAWAAPSRTAAAASGADEAPVLEVSLDAPEQPYPEIAASIGALDSARRAAELAGMKSARESFTTALQAAKPAIENGIRNLLRSKQLRGSGESMPRRASDADAASVTSSMRLLSRRSNKSTSPAHAIVLNVVSPPKPDAVVLADLSSLEAERATAEKHMFDKVAAQMDAITKSVLDQLRANQRDSDSSSDELASGFAEFGRSAEPAQGVARLVASSAEYPTISAMAQAMQARRDLAEQLNGMEILGMESALAKAELSMAHAALAKAEEQVSGA